MQATKVELEGRVAHDIRRIADNLEKLANDPEVEIEAGPPICPHCGMLNPTVSVMETGGSGPLGEWVFEAECHNCNHIFYGLVESWSMFTFMEGLKTELEQRAEQNGNN